MNYLYGAAVQGIQNFIFQTNELKDIVGASELVENICTEKFENLLKKCVPDFASLEDDENAILNAAGNIKYIFTDSSVCERVVKAFPKEVIIYAPGVTVSQAVVKYQFESEFSDAVDKLEQLLRAQRNKPFSSTTLGLMGIQRSRKTNLPVVDIEYTPDNKLDYLDAATLAKRYHVKNGQQVVKRNATKLPALAFDMPNLQRDEVAINIEQMTAKNDWIAVIHADGNGLGQVVQKIGKDKGKFKSFSKKLDRATKNAAIEAFNFVKTQFEWENVIPIRPIVLGGDDLTVVCRADLALDYVTTFIEYFEKYTGFDELEGVFSTGERKLTACAGVAFIKSSYPFYYGYELAEALCSRAKKDAKKNLKQVGSKMGLPDSCLMFHKVQDSFVESFDEIAERELSPQDYISFEFGPYYLYPEGTHDDSKWTIEKLRYYIDLVSGKALKDSKRGNAVKSHLRNWLSMLHDNPGMADQKRQRLIELLETKNEDDKKLLDMVNDITESTEYSFSTAVYDILVLNTIYSQETKKKGGK